jgi:hypothetical protein
MDKEEALNDFLKGLRTTLSNAAAYPKDHPYFIKSVEVFKEKIQVLFGYLKAIKLDITLDSLFIDARKHEKTMLYTELASFFHQRKIKSVELKEGLTLEELVAFFSTISMPVKEIPKKGGVKNILKGLKVQHIVLDELDYSSLLGLEGEEVKDVWLCLFNQALAGKDDRKIEELANNFGKVVSTLKPEEIAKDEELKNGLNHFLSYLKEHQKEKFLECSSQILQSISRHKEFFGQDNSGLIKELFNNCDTEDFAGLLWDEVMTDDNFDSLSLSLFSHISGTETHKDIAASFLEKAKKNKEAFWKNPKAVKKTQQLLSTGDKKDTPSPFISEVYKNTLSALLKDTYFDKSSAFDRNALHTNYLFVLLNLLEMEKEKESIIFISDKITKELEGLTQEGDFNYLRNLLDIVRRKKQEDPTLTDAFEGIDKGIYNFAEEAIWDEKRAKDLDYFIDNMEVSLRGENFYLEKIFNEEKFNPYVLKLFFKVFAGSAVLFYKSLSRKASEMEFLAKLIGDMILVNPGYAKEVLKNIYYSSNQIIKIEVLKTMQRLPEFDTEFLFSVLAGREVPLKKEALRVLIKDEKARAVALDKLLSLSSFWGRNSQLLMENIMIVWELGFRDAEGRLADLSKRKFFWNAGVRNKARQVLKDWNA